MKRRHMKWFLRAWAPLGYKAVHTGSGHLKVLDPEGNVVTVLSSTPRNSETVRREGTRALRRYHAGRGRGRG